MISLKQALFHRKGTVSLHAMGTVSFKIMVIVSKKNVAWDGHCFIERAVFYRKGIVSWIRAWFHRKGILS